MYICICVLVSNTGTQSRWNILLTSLWALKFWNFLWYIQLLLWKDIAVYSVEKNNSRMCYIDRFVNTIVSVCIGSGCMLGSLQSICCVFIVIWWSSVFQNWHLITYPLSLNLKSWAELCLLSFLIVALWKTWEEGHTVLSESN